MLITLINRCDSINMLSLLTDVNKIMCVNKVMLFETVTHIYTSSNSPTVVKLGFVSKRKRFRSVLFGNVFTRAAVL